MLKAKPYRRKYETLHITRDTTREELGNFIENRDAVGVKINGIGFCANTTLTLNNGNSSREVPPGIVILKHNNGKISLIGSDLFSALFYEEDK